MSLYTSKYFKDLASSYKGKEWINESINLSRQQRARGVNRNERFDIFLSHSFLDQDEVYGIFIELTNQGYKVYVDWIIDSHLDRNTVTKQSAELIRHRMKCSKSLISAISTNSKMSKWMPWELGFVDGKTSQCALMPVSQDSSGSIKTFKRYEYLLLYPYLKNADLRGFGKKAYVINEGRSYVDLNSWVNYEASPINQGVNIDFL